MKIRESETPNTLLRPSAYGYAISEGNAIRKAPTPMPSLNWKQLAIGGEERIAVCEKENDEEQKAKMTSE
eukprot:scaffold136939_cov35-Tisochrysis_lutea.AAC.1